MASLGNTVCQSSSVIVAIAAGPRARRLCDGLRRAGFVKVTYFEPGDASRGAILQADPTVVIIDLSDPDDDEFERALELVRAVARPTVLFVDRTTWARTRAAVEAGVGCYVINGFSAARVAGVIEMALARHDALMRAHSELAAKDHQRAEREIIEQAKELLMARDGLTEADAYSVLRKASMNHNQRLVEIARLVIARVGGV